jgi:hypothetical protein
MNSQNILKFFGSKLDLKLDNSELYDFELVGVDNDYDKNLLDLTTGGTITYDSLVFDSNCVNGLLLPYTYNINEQYSGGTCEFLIRRRTELGWTIDATINKAGEPWSNGHNLFYFGINSESEPEHYLDNNLSFKFTSGGTIQWISYRYSGYCDTVSGFTETNYISSGQTSQMFEEPLLSNNDLIFNISITFKRYSEYIDCDIANEGGWNDMITGVTVNNPTDVMTGATESVSYIEVLNEKWWNERNKRLGTLSIYINGKRIYKLENWEEIVPSKRDGEHLIQHVWGGGLFYSGGIHDSLDTSFSFQRFRYYEEPLNPIQINHNYLTSVKPYYNITDVTEPCSDTPIGLTDIGLLTENNENILTEDNNILVY